MDYYHHHHYQKKKLTYGRFDKYKTKIVPVVKYNYHCLFRETCGKVSV